MMTALVTALFGAAVLIALQLLLRRRIGFAAQQPSDYAAQGPSFDVRKHLNGPIQCEGVLHGPTGRVTARFVADMDAQWKGETGKMFESFRYDSGTVQDRFWDLKIDKSGRIRATGPDIVGTGHGVQKGSSVMLTYRIRLPESSGGHVLSVTDWMYLLENGAIINRSQFRKFGFTVAELVATMRPKSAAAPQLG